MPDALSASANGRPSAEAPDLDGEPLALDRPIPTTLDDIRVPVEDDLEAFRSYFREAMRSDHMLLDKITQYVLCTATLVHDDVVDDAEERRGVFSINALWKNKIAVLMGDFLLSRGLLLSLDHGDYSILHTLSDAVRRMSEGELLQIEKSRLLDIDEETYFRIISDKTASLISACTKSGAVSVTDDEALIERMDKFGETLGLAFQIRDDLFDFSVEDAGKPVGIDLQEKKMTLPLIVALREADRREKKRILKIVDQDDKDRDDLRTIGAFVDEHGGIEYARSKMESLAANARSLLSALPPSEARASLAGLT
ncbi:MAG: polyprenyl synthetase, partial [Bacteroidetes bacterium QH_1_64_81]